MKNVLHILLFFIAASPCLTAQAPQGIQYQAVIRDMAGDPLPNAAVHFRFTITDGTGNTVYYQETQQTLSNALGGIVLVVGSGNPTQGSFAATEWKKGDTRVQVEMDPTGGSNFLPFGNTDFQSVPYALFAERAGKLVDGNGNDWGPDDDEDQQTLSVNGNQLSISNGNVVTLPTGSGGGDNWGSQTIETHPTLEGDGTLSSPLRIASQGALNGEVLKWNGNTWQPDTDDGEVYAAGDGIEITGGVIHNTGDDDDNPSNELQTLSLNGNTLALTNGGSVNLPIVNYQEGTGININGSTISAENTTNIWNANQLQNRNVSSMAPSNGQVLKYDGVAWVPGSDNGTNYSAGTGINIAGSTISAQNTTDLWNANQLRDFPIAADDPTIGSYLRYVPPIIGGAAQWRPSAGPATIWETNGSNIFYNGGNVGIGTGTPLAALHINGTSKIRMEDMEFGKWATVSIAFSSNVVCDVDGNRSLGVVTRRWQDVWAVDGTINTSDARDKENIKELQYGINDIMQLRPVTYTWKKRPESGVKIGLIAQELEAVIPEVVANAQRTPSLLSEVPENPDELRLGVYYSDLIPVLVKAIQEQEVRIQALQQEIELLKNK